MKNTAAEYMIVALGFITIMAIMAGFSHLLYSL